ncbi:MAG: dodecin [Planctomycetota bacterium]|jgi:flavin-binding protein dodecin
MSNIYKKIEIVGTSAQSFAHAADCAVTKAAESLHGLNWFEATEMRGKIVDGKIAEYQVTLKVGLKLD